MRYATLAIVAVLLLVPVWLVPINRFNGESSVSAEAAPYVAVINQYCASCHDQAENAAGLAFDELNFDRLHQDAEVWEKVVRKVKAGVMPPSGEPRPERQVLDNLAVAIEERIDENAGPAVNPGSKALHRLNRAEYTNTIRDLLGLDINVETLLPEDDASEGFDNIAQALNISPTHIESYVNSAMKISRLAVGDRTLLPSRNVYRIPAQLDQSKHIEGLPLGTRGGMVFEHFFPLDAHYEFRLGSRGRAFLGGDTGEGNAAYKLSVTIDGEEIEAGSPRGFRIPIAAGPHRIGIAVVDLHDATGVNGIFSRGGRQVAASDVIITGPYDVTGAGETPSRDKIFICYPEQAEQEEGCAREIIQNIASLAFRKPLAQDSEEVGLLMGFYGNGFIAEGFEGGIQHALARVLVDPLFLYRFELEPEDAAPGEIYAIDGLELASRLSFFLWSSIPDWELLRLGADGDLNKPAILEQQVKRMLSDPKSKALIDNFAGQWLQLRSLATVESDSQDFDHNLRVALQTETEMLFADIVQNNLSVMTLLDSDYTFVNERLASHYGIPNVTGSYFRKITFDNESPRRGLLGQGSILTVTSVANRTSPVIRGTWVLENLLGVPAPQPPAGVETDLDNVKVEGKINKVTSVREKLEQHRADPVCASCHDIMDPLGLALENFDLVGKWREYDGSSPVDVSGQLVDGTPLHSPNDLRAALLERSEVFVSTLTEKLMTYALGRPVEYHDMPSVRHIVAEAEENNYQFLAIAMGIVGSDAFQKRIKNKID